MKGIITPAGANTRKWNVKDRTAKIANISILIVDSRGKRRNTLYGVFINDTFSNLKNT